MHDLQENAHFFTLKCVYYCKGAFTLSSFQKCGEGTFVFLSYCFSLTFLITVSNLFEISLILSILSFLLSMAVGSFMLK